MKKILRFKNIEVIPNHTHMIRYFSPDKTPTNTVKNLKRISVRERLKKYPETKSQLWSGHLWSSSYFMSTLGNASKKL
ncbi:IS200/IS605 family transposase [Companilactobacillus paralimentarius]|uniref:IS200/IS605 family transposase n=1 Tax=Companilactobacillus paralimentarius TaxID=83526 RepID=UPI0009DE840B|nr:IS200/IS605 family transposase [Companilactobacillus paralimentarius]